MSDGPPPLEQFDARRRLSSMLFGDSTSRWGGTKNRSRARPLREQEEARERCLSCATFPTESVHGCPSFFFVFLHGSRSRRLAQTTNPSSQHPRGLGVPVGITS